MLAPIRRDSNLVKHRTMKRRARDAGKAIPIACAAALVVLPQLGRTCFAVESIHFGYIDAEPAMTNSLRLPTRDGTLWWSANKQRYNAEDGLPVAYSYHDGYVENGFFINGTTHTAAEAAARWRSIMTGNGDPWTGVSGAQIGTPSIIILDELVANFTDGGNGTLLRNALQTYLTYPGATRNDIAAFLSPGFCQSTSIVLSNYDDLVYSANNYLRSIQLELYATEANFNSGGETYLASQFGAPLRKWTTTFGVSASRVQPTLLVSNLADAAGGNYPAFLNRQFQFMANGWYTAGHAFDANVATALRNGVSSYTWTPGTADYQLLTSETLRDAYFEEFLNWYSVQGNTTLNNLWTADANGIWSGGANWLTGNSAGGVNAWGKFLFPITQPRTVTLTSPATVGHLLFDNVNAYTFNGTGVLTLQVSGGLADATVLSGNHTITNPVTLNSSTTFAITPAASTLTMTGQIITSANVTKTGDGKLAVKNIRAANLSITGGAVEVLANGTSAGTSVLTSLSISGGKLDVKNNKLIVRSTSPGSWDGDAYTGITGMIQSGRFDGSWTGGGIVTSMTEATSGVLTTLAVATADETGYAGSSFGGISVNSGDVLIMYTWGGDADLNGELNGDDYFYIDSNVLQSGVVFGFHNGDFDYNGEINGDDYFILDSNILFAQGSLPFPTGSAIGDVAADFGELSRAVPEPGLTAALIALPFCLRPRRRAKPFTRKGLAATLTFGVK